MQEISLRKIWKIGTLAGKEGMGYTLIDMKKGGMAMEKQGRKTIPITPSLRLVPYYPAYETTLPWYQDAELCHQVDNQNRIYDLSILKNM